MTRDEYDMRVSAMLDAVRQEFTKRGKTREHVDIYIGATLDPIQAAAMRRHYTDGEPVEATNAWYLAAMRAAFTKDGLGSVLPPPP